MISSRLGSMSGDSLRSKSDDSAFLADVKYERD